jgi:uncharacterized protein YkwD
MTFGISYRTLKRLVVVLWLLNLASGTTAAMVWYATGARLPVGLRLPPWPIFATRVVTPSPTLAPTTTSIPSATPSPSDTPTAPYTPIATDTETPTPTGSATETPTDTPTWPWTFTSSLTPSHSVTRSSTPTSSRTRTSTATLSDGDKTATASSPTPAWTPSNTPSFTPSYTEDPLMTRTPTKTPTDTFTPSFTPSPSFTFTSSYTPQPTPTFTSTTANPCSTSYNASLENQVIALINQERTSRGLAALTPRSQLTTAARLHGVDMACNNFTSHTGSDGSSVGDRVRRQGYAWTWIGENLYWGGGDPAGVVGWWMNSTDHRNNILGANYTSIGAGYVYSAITHRNYWIVVFARP